jgi:hypothetical protein
MKGDAGWGSIGDNNTGGQIAAAVGDNKGVRKGRPGSDGSRCAFANGDFGWGQDTQHRCAHDTQFFGQAATIGQGVIITNHHQRFGNRRF